VRVVCTMRMLVVGSKGQLEGRWCASLVKTARWFSTLGPARMRCCQPDIIQDVVAARPDVCDQRAAWTDVDAAEANPDAAYAVNALGPHYLAEACDQIGAWLVHVSTNEVFAGTPGRTYREYDLPQPGGVYARSKLAGELAVVHTARRTCSCGWPGCSVPRRTNFPAKIVAAADRHGQLRVVNDEYGNPTYAPDVAAALRRLIRCGHAGIFHLVNGGSASGSSLRSPYWL